MHYTNYDHYVDQVTALLQTLEMQQSAQHKGHLALCNCLVLGHTKYKGVQRIYCNQLPAKPFYYSHQMDLVIIRIDNGAFGVSPDTVWYALDLLLYSASATTDTGYKSFNCTLVSTLETYDNPENDYYLPYCIYIYYAYCIYDTDYLHCIMVEIDWFSNCIRA